ncbi:MAG: SUMF1/EgtB/PvdO family nonheme iron enzyme [Nitrospinae bacterium]|nr:SUMF1/EgtB/PvdO family nonheme iron enzyme [Nitrospinota bacterium]
MTRIRPSFWTLVSFAVLAIAPVVAGFRVQDLSYLDKETVKDMAYIPAGTFTRGCDGFGPEHGSPEQTVYLDAFFIDKYEATNKLFEAIFPDHELRRSPFSSCDECPVSKVTWYDAADYCYLTGKSLPSEAQWEKAAGAASGCEFPWGPEFDPAKPQARGGLKLRQNAAPVGSLPPNKYGVHDMAGNMWEWVTDWYAPYFFAPETLYNPRGPKSGIMKTRRGGSWSDSVKAMAAGYRDWSNPSSRGLNDVGFRCAINIANSK